MRIEAGSGEAGAVAAPTTVKNRTHGSSHGFTPPTSPAGKAAPAAVGGGGAAAAEAVTEEGNKDTARTESYGDALVTDDRNGMVAEVIFGI